MVAITLRADLTRGLTNEEIDANMTNLKAAAEAAALTASWAGVTGKPATLAGYGITDAQPVDADLTAIAALAGTSGFLKKTAANTWALDTSTYLTGITSGQVTTALGFTPYNATNPNGYITSSASISGTSAAVNYTDTRTISPSSHGANRLTFGFTSWSNNNTSPWADYLHLRGYTDATGGSDNLLMFRKDGLGIRVWQQSFGSATAYSTFKDVAWTDGTNASGTWGINVTGSAATLTTGRTIAMTGDVTYTSGSFNGSANVTGTATLAASGVTAGTYGSSTNIPQLTVDAKGRVTAVSNVAVSIPSGSLTFTGDVTGTGTTGSSTALTLANSGVTAGTYTKVTVDAKGRVTTGAALAAGDVPTLNQSTTGNAGSVTNGVYTTGEQTITARKIFSTTNSAIASASGDLSTLEVRSTSTGAAFMAFHRPTLYAAYFGLDSDNVWKVGGWSMGANSYPILHSNNYNTYAPTLTGTGASGTWSINVTGNAGSATTAARASATTVPASTAFTKWLFATTSTSGTLDWNHVSNTNPGVGETLLLGTATNGPGGSNYYHPFNIEYSGISGVGNVTQMAVAYGNVGNELYMRGRFGGTWTGWSRYLNSSNYNAYSPTLTGTGASGTWGISVSGSAGSVSGGAVSASSVYNSGMWYTFPDANRDANNAVWSPSAVTRGVAYFFGTASSVGTGGNYAGVMQFNPWIGTTASTGDASYQLAFGSTAANGGGVPQLRIRKGIDTTWNSWYDLLTSANYSTYALPLTGGALSGVLTINSTSDNQLLLQSTDSWTGIGFNDSAVLNTEYIWHNGTNGTFAIGGGGANVAGKKLHVHGGMTVGAGYATTGNPTNGLNVEGAIQQAGNQVLHAGNHTSYSPSLTGTGASGSWGISVTGSAATLTTARTINGVSFNGSANITVADSTKLPLAGGTLTGALTIQSAAPILNFFESDQTLPAGRRRFVQDGNAFSLRRNTAAGGDFSTEVYDLNVDASGNFTALGNVTAYSDERLKRDWAPVASDFVARLATLKSGTYTRIDSGERQAGSSAQDWQKLLPEVVASKDETGILGLAYGNAALVSAIELAKDNLELRARIERLEAALSKLIGD